MGVTCAGPVDIFPNVKIACELVSLLFDHSYLTRCLRHKVNNHSKGLTTIFLTLDIAGLRSCHNPVVGARSCASFLLVIELLN